MATGRNFVIRSAKEEAARKDGQASNAGDDETKKDSEAKQNDNDDAAVGEEESVIWRLTYVLTHVNEVLYSDGQIKDNLLKCARLIKQREGYKLKLKSLNKRMSDIEKLLKKNSQEMKKMAYCHIGI